MEINAPGILEKSLKNKLQTANNQTLYTYFKSIATQPLFSEKPAVFTLGNQLQELSYSKLLIWVDRVAAGLSNLKLDPKRDRIALFMPTGKQWLISALACSKLGIPMVCLKSYAAACIWSSLKSTEASAILINEASFPLANAVHLGQKYLGKIVWYKQSENPDACILSLWTGNPGNLKPDWSDFIELLPVNDTDRVLSASAEAFHQTLWLSFSSGTTGMPKAIALTNENVVLNSIIVGHKMRYAELNQSGDPQRVCSFFPYFPAGGMIVGLFAPLFNGAGLVCTDGIFSDTGKLLPEKAMQLVQASKASIIVGPPPLLSELLCLANRPVLNHLEMAMIGSTWCSSHLFNQIKNELRGDGKPIHMMVTYGQTEAGVITHVGHMRNRNVSEYPKYVLPVGKALPGIEMKIVEFDHHGKPLLHKPVHEGSRGMLMIKGYSIMQGYYNNPAKTSKTLLNIQGDVWLKTDDLFVKKGHTYICQGRYKEFLPCPGDAKRKILPIEIEPYIMYEAQKLKLPIHHVQVVAVNQNQKKTLIACLKGEELSSFERYILDKNVKKKLSAHFTLAPSLNYIVMPAYPLNASSKIDRMAIQKLVERENLGGIA